MTLRVVEVGRNSDDGVLDGLAEVGLSSLLHLLQDETTDLGWRVLLATSLDPGVAIGVLHNLVWDFFDIALDFRVGEFAADETLGREESVLWVDNSLTLRRNTDETLAIFSEGNDRRSCASTLGVFYYTWLLAFHDGNGRVCCSQVNADDLALDLLGAFGRVGRSISGDYGRARSSNLRDAGDGR